MREELPTGQGEQQLAGRANRRWQANRHAALASTGQGLERGTHKATFCYIGWEATGQGPVISWRCAVGKEQRSEE